MLRANRHMKQYRAVEGMYNLDMSEFALVGVSFFLFAIVRSAATNSNLYKLHCPIIVRFFTVNVFVYKYLYLKT